MKRNRILAIGIALLLAVQLLTPLACAAGTTLKLTAPDKLPDVGQTFTVAVELTGNTGLGAVQIKLGYDDSVVECTGIENGALVVGMLAASNPHATRGGVGAILAAASRPTAASSPSPSGSRRRATRSSDWLTQSLPIRTESPFPPRTRSRRSSRRTSAPKAPALPAVRRKRPISLPTTRSRTRTRKTTTGKSPKRKRSPPPSAT